MTKTILNKSAALLIAIFVTSATFAEVTTTSGNVFGNDLVAPGDRNRA